MEIIDLVGLEVDFRSKKIKVTYLVVRGKKITTNYEANLEDYPLISSELPDIVGNISMEDILRSLKRKETQKGNIKYIITRLTNLQMEILSLFYKTGKNTLFINEIFEYLTRKGYKIRSIRSIGGAVGSLNRIIRKYRNSKLIKIVKSNGKTVGFSINNRSLLKEIVESMNKT